MASRRSPLAESFIAVSGNIGAGKSTLVEGLSSRLGTPGFLESHEKNPYLAPFYREPRQWAFHTQVSFLSLSIQDYRAVQRSGGRGVLERTLDEHHYVFATHLHEDRALSEGEFEILDQLHRAASLRPAISPSLVIYLRAPAAELLRRVQARDRGAEVAAVGIEYLTALNRRYDSFARSWSACPLVTIDTATIDVRDQKGVAAVVARCEQAWADSVE